MNVKANGNKALTGLGFIFCYCKIFSRKKEENQKIDKNEKNSRPPKNRRALPGNRVRHKHPKPNPASSHSSGAAETEAVRTDRAIPRPWFSGTTPTYWRA